ncbi:hypothetical protein SEA_PUPPER_26 [Gordonia phage Pupper]|uniref:Uncharacterized protein n=1 Tax=Gordonia phage Pupper TaxID=2571249 RepID=A0A4Y6EIG7_9CAUD|nr:hypothetical protein KHQ83_gp026 [Gordonia phage Pupper]QDF18513.1 hypothetical protein SEA_PUPPER_26 [Gordonia phage Pupper]QDF18746.1 hypothetical protein SEA_SCENTAE_26 [Gordonia phage SCentae]
MSEFSVTRARGDQETRAIREGILSATGMDGPFQFGQYVERFDGGQDGDRSDDSLWTPVIYEAEDFEHAQEMHDSQKMDIGLGDSAYRRSCVVRRGVLPWEVFA